MTTPIRHPTQSIKLAFPNAQNHMLDARLDRPADVEPHAYVIICHCFTCTKETLTTSRVSRGLAQAGFGVLRFDFTGLGDSSGQFADSHFTTMVSDVLSASAYLTQHFSAPVALLGHSMGGTAVLAAAMQIPSCTTVITLASPSHPSHVLHHFGPAMNKLESGIDAEIRVAGVAYPVKPQFIHDVRQYSFEEKLNGFNLPILAIRAGKDSLVPASDADEILALTSAEHQLFELENADHLFSDRQDTQAMIEAISQWLYIYSNFE
jgi:putative redox protein